MASSLIDPDRLSDTFQQLVRIDSISKEERELVRKLRPILDNLGAETIVDRAGERIGGQTGNLIARFPGNRDVAPMLFSAHMDTVEPGRGIRPVVSDGVFRSDGSTILGADDKNAIAVLLEILHILVTRNLPHGPIDLVLTVCEEIGLLGSRYLDFDCLRARIGYVLDSRDTEAIVIRAPSANRFDIVVHGREAHAGAAPETGINAIALAARAISTLETGRIDEETTCNIGLIHGGIATNIVPNRVPVAGEVRSHDEQKLRHLTGRITDTFQGIAEASGVEAADGLPRVDIHVTEQFTRTSVPENHPVVLLARQAARNLGRELTTKSSGGGADANVFFQNGITTGVLGTGPCDIHSVRESIALTDMVRAAELVMEIVRLHAEAKSEKFKV